MEYNMRHQSTNFINLQPILSEKAMQVFNL